MDNTDDYERNHALLADDTGALRLSRAYDVLPSGQALGYPQLRLGAQGHDATLENALSELRHYGMKPDRANAIVRLVARAVAGWKGHFQARGVSSADIEFLAQQIDRRALLDPRNAYTG